MFTGLVEALVTMTDVHREPPGVRLVFLAHHLVDDIKSGKVKIGDSFAINGCCLTLVAINADRLSFQAGEETLRRTNLGHLQPGSKVNLERPLRVGDELGGHLVSRPHRWRRHARRPQRQWPLVHILVLCAERADAANRLQRLDRHRRREPDIGRR